MERTKKTSLTQEERLEANKLINDLTSLSEHFFEIATAKHLIDLIPLHDKKSFFISFTPARNKKREGQEGHAAGFGNISFPETKEKKTFSTDATPVWCIGNYKVKHNKGRLTISKLLDEWATCTLHYTPKTQEPNLMKIMDQISFEIPFSAPVICGFYKKWKTPLESIPPDNSCP